MTASPGPTPRPTPRHAASNPPGDAAQSAEATPSTSSAPEAPPAEADEQPPLTKPLADVADGTDAAPVAASSPNAIGDQPSLGQLVSQASESVSTLVRSEIELAKVELKSTVKNVGIGTVLFVLAAVIALYALTFAFIGAGEGIALVLPRWAAFLIVFGLLLLVAGAAVFVGLRLVKKAKAPEQTIKTTKETVDYLKNARS